MSLRDQIKVQFLGKAFERPLFYKYPNGLRFELSEGGSVLEQFLTALRKASQICSHIFTDQITVCLQVYAWNDNHFAYRTILHDLKAAGIYIPKEREIWLEPQEDELEPMRLSIAFKAPKELLQNLLWCSVARDFSSIRPNPGCNVYLFNFTSKLMVWAYDDRGMDVVGSNHHALKALYTQFSSYLLEYDRAAMEMTFAFNDSMG